MTVVWSLFANLLPISGNERLVIFLARYIAICLGLARGLDRLCDSISLKDILKKFETIFCILSTVITFVWLKTSLRMFFFPRKLSTFSHLLHRGQSTHVTRYMLRSRVAHRTGLCSKNSHVLSEPTTGAHQHALSHSFALVVLDIFLQLSDELPAFSKV